MKTPLLFLMLYALSSCTGQTNTHVLIVKCENDLHVKEDKLKIKISYLNNSNDTMVLPINELSDNNFQEVIFNNQEKCFCSKSSKRLWPTDRGNCDMEQVRKEGMTVLLPHEEVSREFSFEELACVNCDFEKGKEYTYFVNLNIDSRFKNYCNKVWTGKVSSAKGSLIVE